MNKLEPLKLKVSIVLTAKDWVAPCMRLALWWYGEVPPWLDAFITKHGFRRKLRVTQ